MKIIKDLPDNNGEKIEKTTENDTFFDDLSSDLFEAVCRGLDAPMHPMALVSDQLMVLRQTHSCRNLLENEGFYSIEGVLLPDECEIIRQSIRTGTEYTTSVTLFDQRWNMRIVPTEQQGALLIFLPDMSHQVGITLAAARLRESAGHLLMQADMLEMDGVREDACFIRREALRILRHTNHAQLLCGAPEPIHREECSAGQVLACAVEQLERRGVHVDTACAAADVRFWVDKGMLLSALMTLISNSLRHGGAHVHIVLRAEQQRDSIVFRVEDDGTGLSDEALARMNDTWRQTDTHAVGNWGLGVPYARRIAELHGGMLIFTQRTGGGCAALLRLPLTPPDGCGLESESSYRAMLAADVCAADIELSDVLECGAYEKN